MRRLNDAPPGRIPGRDGFCELYRIPDARPVPGLALWIIEGSLLFFTTDYVKTRLDAIGSALPAGTRWLVIDASAVVQIDSCGADMIESARSERAARLGLREPHPEVRQLLDRAGGTETIGATMIFEDLDDALRAWNTAGAAPVAADREAQPAPVSRPAAP